MSIVTTRDDGQAGPLDQTSEDLEHQLEDGTAGPEEAALHLDDAVTEVLDDEREIEDRDVGGDAGEELEWRIAEARGDDVGSSAPTRSGG